MIYLFLIPVKGIDPVKKIVIRRVYGWADSMKRTGEVSILWKTVFIRILTRGRVYQIVFFL